MTSSLTRRKFTTAQYHQMAEAGILAAADRVELLHGEIVEMSPIGSRHAACVKRLVRLFSQLSEWAIVGVQDPIELNRNSEPQPDLALLKPRPDFYASRHPQPEEVLLLVEVADTTVEFDRTVKVPLYAQAEIAEVWLVDLQGEAIEVYRQPAPGGYLSIQIFRCGEHVTGGAIGEVRFLVDEVLG
jgi:Uma2 family endonuclease